MHLYLIGLAPALLTHILLWLFWFLLCIKFFNSITTSVSFSGSGEGGGVITCSCQTSSIIPSSRGGGNGTSARGGTSIITWKISIRVLYNWLQNGGFTWHKCCFIDQSNESYHEKVVTQPSFSAVRCKTHVK